MLPASMRIPPRRYQAAAVVMGLGAVAGWGLLSGSRGSTAVPEHQLSAPASELRAGQSPISPKQDQA